MVEQAIRRVMRADASDDVNDVSEMFALRNVHITPMLMIKSCSVN